MPSMLSAQQVDIPATDMQLPKISNVTTFIDAVERPETLREMKQEAEVMVKVYLDKEGNVEQFVLLHATHPEFAEKVRAKLSILTFSPIVENGQNVRGTIVLPIRYIPYRK